MITRLTIWIFFIFVLVFFFCLHCSFFIINEVIWNFDVYNVILSFFYSNKSKLIIPFFVADNANFICYIQLLKKISVILEYIQQLPGICSPFSKTNTYLWLTFASFFHISFFCFVLFCFYLWLQWEGSCRFMLVHLCVHVSVSPSGPVLLGICSLVFF